ncbi:sensor histidine kinase [Cellulomonas sp. 179-A 9B4 NHS]|uniref:sensor histidine kinase n=1 Tax=Cellulomonas sp. 179-A 9B4 NHS TaxID=3142379 RepID=UPI0039A1B176
MVDLRRARTAWDGADVTVRDLPLALAVAVAPLVPSLSDQGTELGDLADRPHDALTVVAVLLQGLPLAVRRRWPTGCLALVSLGFAVDQLGGYHSAAGIALPVALLSAGAHLSRRRAAVAVTASVGYAGLAAALARLGSTEELAGYVTFYLVMAVAWGVGTWLRQTRAAEAEHRRHVEDAARATERARLARELHDVVTHHVTAMVVQAEAARYVTADPARVAASLTAVTSTGRRAIDDLRNLLDVLDPAHGPGDRMPTVGDVAALVETTRLGGQPVEYLEEGSSATQPGSAEVTAYRVVQEALTNALKHARGSRTVVRVRHQERSIDVEVTTEGGTPAAEPREGSGRGLAGLRERVALLGGDLDAGREADGGFVVHARIPTGRRP